MFCCFWTSKSSGFGEGGARERFFAEVCRSHISGVGHAKTLLLKVKDQVYPGFTGSDWTRRVGNFSSCIVLMFFVHPTVRHL